MEQLEPSIEARENRGRSEPKEQTLTRDLPSETMSIADASVIKDQNLFLLSRPDGMIPMEGNHGYGLYFQDTRYLSGYEIYIDGLPLHSLVANDSRGFVAVHHLTNPEMRLRDGHVLDAQKIGIQWIRRVHGEEGRLSEVLNIENYCGLTAEFTLRLEFRLEVEDVFLVRGLWREIPGRQEAPFWKQGRLHSRYLGADRITRSSTIQFSRKPSFQDESAAEFTIRLRPRERDQLMITLLLGETQGDELLVDKRDVDLSEMDEYREVAEVAKDRPLNVVQVLGGVEVRSDSLSLSRILDRCARDLEMLRSDLDNRSYFAAGLPWFGTLFGRDSLLTALEVLAFQPNVARDTLRLLAEFQGQRNDPWRDENPGKILHEIRFGELAEIGRVPHTPYYGTADATSLFLILLARYIQWTGDLDLFDELEKPVMRALEWLDRYGDTDGDGYQDYRSDSQKGLINQGWKDSGNAIVRKDGTIATPPIALVELQALAYRAKRDMAPLLEIHGDEPRAESLLEWARDLKRRFNKDFWLKGEGIYTLGLEAGGRMLDVVTSNAGHALWAGIADEPKAASTVARLMKDDMYNGWGIRTLSSEAKAYNPIGYHLGTVWPHDNALLLGGFRRYGFDKEALRLFDSLALASTHFTNFRVPELFSGFSRDAYGVPVSYPVACRPQAWSAAAFPYMLSELLGLRPDALHQHLTVMRPLLPTSCDVLTLRQVRVGKASVDLQFKRVDEFVAAKVLRVEGKLHVSIEL